MPHIHKKMPWLGWSKEQPGTHERTVQRKRCGSRCFMGPGKSFPVCRRGTCKVSPDGVYAAYVRGKQYHRKTVSNKAKRWLKKKGLFRDSYES